MADVKEEDMPAPVLYQPGDLLKNIDIPANDHQVVEAKAEEVVEEKEEENPIKSAQEVPIIEYPLHYSLTDHNFHQKETSKKVLG